MIKLLLVWLIKALFLLCLIALMVFCHSVYSYGDDCIVIIGNKKKRDLIKKFLSGFEKIYFTEV